MPIWLDTFVELEEKDRLSSILITSTSDILVPKGWKLNQLSFNTLLEYNKQADLPKSLLSFKINSCFIFLSELISKPFSSTIWTFIQIDFYLEKKVLIYEVEA